jgi:hypothetical protein
MVSSEWCGCESVLWYNRLVMQLNNVASMLFTAVLLGTLMVHILVGRGGCTLAAKIYLLQICLPE